MTTMTNSMLHITIACISLVFVVLIVQHAVFLWHVPFRISRGGRGNQYIMDFRGAKTLLFDSKLGGKKGDVTNHPNSYRFFPDANNDNNWTISISSWFLKRPQDYIWPIDINDERVFNFYRTGKHHCSPIFNGSKIVLNNVSGNSRFIDSNNPFSYHRIEDVVFIKLLN